MYISPERMPDDHWSVLGHALRWADANTQVFRRTQMIGGRPDQGEAYGFLHRSDGKMIACLRNPSPLPSRLAIDLVGQPRRTGGSPVRAGEPQAPHAAWQPIIVYPSRQKLAGVAEHSSLEVDLPGSSVVVVELYRDLPTSLRSLPPGYFDAIASAAGTRLVEYEPPRFAPIGPREPPRFDRKNYAATYELGASANRVDAGLSLVRYPAGGARLSLLSDAETRPPQTIAPKHGAWDLASYTLPADASRLELAISLPPSPFWPQRSTACVVWHETQKLAIRKETELSAAEDQPAWPMIVQPGAITRDVVLIDHQPFYRRRSAGESLAWVFLLGVTPVSACGALVWRRTAQRSFWQRCACATLALAALAALYACTPIAAALGRALSG
jgi:hypothetical protein